MNREDGAALARKASKEQSRISERQRSDAVVHQGRIGVSEDALPQICADKTVIVGAYAPQSRILFGLIWVSPSAIS